MKPNKQTTPPCYARKEEPPDIVQSMKKAPRQFKSPTFRMWAWDNCRTAFSKALTQNEWDEELLALHLSSYLASFGMYRGSSPLLQTNYRALLGITGILRKHSAPFANDFDPCSVQSAAPSRWDDIEMLKRQLHDHFARKLKWPKSKNGNSGSDALVSKVISATTGCILCYDTNVCNALRYYSRGIARFNKVSYECLCQFILARRRSIEEAQRLFEKEGHRTEVFRVLDCYFWYLGQPKKNGD